MRISICYLALLLITTQAYAQKQKQKVCVVGAGMSGLASVKRLADHADEFEPVVFDKNSDVGGLWIYTESTTVDEHGLPVHSSVYQNLRTNVPKELMAWPDYRNFTGDYRSSVAHNLVLQYLRNFTDHFNLRQYIQLNTAVEHVSPINRNDNDWRQTKWLVKTKDLNTGEHKETICNAIMLCNGHFTKPNTPKIPGLEKFQGPVVHSHVYRKPDTFANKTVVVLGGSVSGVDIAVDVSSQSKKIYLSHRHEKIKSELPENIEQVPGVVGANGNDLVLSNGSSIHADAFIFCTGYKPEFPFLDESCGIKIDRGHVFPLYKQMINAENPSLAVIGIPTATSIYLIPYVQSQYFVALLQGKVQLPPYEEMIEDASHEPPGARKGKFHAVDDYQWTYNDELAKAAGGLELPPSYYKDGLHLYEAYRDEHLATFREVLFRFNPDGTFRLVIPQQQNERNEA